MKTFEIEITETLQTVHNIEANNYSEAYDIVSNKYNKEEIVLTSDEYVDTEITPYLYSNSYSIIVNNPVFKSFILKKAEDMLSDLSTEELIKLSFGDIESAISRFKSNNQ